MWRSHLTGARHGRLRESLPLTVTKISPAFPKVNTSHFPLRMRKTSIFICVFAKHPFLSVYSQNIHFYLCLRKTSIFIGACNYFLLHAQKQLFPLRMCKTTISICACAKHQLSTEQAQNNNFLLRMRRNNYFLCACARAHVHKTTSTRSYFLLHMSTQISFFCTRTYCISFSQSWAGDNSVATM